LGIIIEEHLTWRAGISLVMNKAATLIAIIKKELKSTLPCSKLEY